LAVCKDMELSGAVRSDEYSVSCIEFVHVMLQILGAQQVRGASAWATAAVIRVAIVMCEIW